jgi:hypothetical protein
MAGAIAAADDDDDNQLISIQFFNIYVLSQQLQGRLHKQHCADTIN